MDESLLWIAFRDTPGLLRFQAKTLLERYGSPAAIFGRPQGELRLHCASRSAIALARGPSLEPARGELGRVRKLGLEVLLPGRPGYPPLLWQLADPPLVLYCRGALPSGPMLSVVGSRRPSARGREVTRGFTGAAARAGVVIVSGLAYGIDAAAHQGALDAGGPTVAVLASGLDRPSPAGNRRLARRILEGGGAWLSEYPPGDAARAYRFPERNRLISGLSPLSLIVEARERSGSLWTARHAAEQNREVAVVPGPVDTDHCRGSNRLLYDGAIPILEAEELIVRVLGDNALMCGSRPAAPKVSGDAGRVLARLRDATQDPDQLSRQLALPPARLASILLELELEGLVTRDGTRIALGPRAYDARPAE
ncbi:MAG: DNA-processing protein DprA [Deltaproteobacteria bacterium]|nr:DNA-protecting protein DprA [Myxococcales bacterium]MCZ6570471.1 DNA-processing protein DprA [Deltaproteobacteria bacterium]MCZ6713216.1 DNA-processing protein DprA [Deltaproteobacteria bacterium]MCZ6822947.1 DNA-processing protein DprA [Deltaproteobacteria bacterium]